MLSNAWSIYRKTFAHNERTIFSAITERERLAITTGSVASLRCETDDEIDDEIEMAFHQSRKRTSARSGPIASQPAAIKTTNENTNSQEPEVQTGGKERALLADPDKKSLLSVATRTDLFESIGTLLSNVQLSNLNSQQLDELALLVSERGVVFFRNQNLSADGQARITQHYETIYPSPSLKRKDSFQDEEAPVKAYANSTAAKETGSLDFESQKEWHATKSYEAKPPSYSLLRTGESSGVAAWVSQYGLYDDLSKHWRGFLDGLHAEHTSRLQDGSQPIVENQHPAIRTHPVTGLKTLNVTPGVVSGFAELKKKESESLLKFLDYHINSSDEHSVRFKLEPGSVAIWDNRSTAHKLISKSGPTGVLGTETTVSGEKPYFNVQSESRQEKTERVAREEQERIQRRKEAKARYNNTPLRRIIQRQALKQDKRVDSVTASLSGEERSYEERSVSEATTEGKNDQSRVVLTKLDPNKNTRNQRTQIWAKDVVSENAILDDLKTDLPDEKVKKAERKLDIPVRGTPLKRIIQRQASGGSGPRRLDWR